MDQKDYILREIEKISALMLGLLGKYKRGNEAEEPAKDEWAKLNQEFTENLPFDLDVIIEARSGDVEHLLTKDLGFDPANIELLADLISGAIPLNKSNPDEAAKRAIELYRLADHATKTFSIERSRKIAELKKRISRPG